MMRRTASRPSISVEDALGLGSLRPRGGVETAGVGLEAAAGAEDDVLGRDQLGEALPLVDHAQAVHQDLLGAEQLAEAARVLDRPARRSGTCPRVQRSTVEEGLAREQIFDLLEIALREPVPRDRQPRQQLRAGIALAVELIRRARA